MKFGVCISDISSATGPAGSRAGCSRTRRRRCIVSWSARTAPDALADPARRDASGREDDERLLDVRAGAARVGEELGPIADGRSNSSAGAVRIGSQEVTRVLDAERDMPRLVDPRAPGDVRRHRHRARSARRTPGTRGTCPRRAPTAGTKPARSPPARRSDRNDVCVIALETWSPPPFASARFVNASMWRASSFTCVARNNATSVKCGWIRGMNRAGTYSAAYSFSARWVMIWHTARSRWIGERLEVTPSDVGGRVPLARRRLLVEGRDVVRPDPVALCLGVGERRRALLHHGASRREAGAWDPLAPGSPPPCR